MSQIENQIKTTLETIQDGKSNKNIVDSGTFTDLHIEKGNVTIILTVDPIRGTELEDLRQKTESKIKELPNINNVNIVLTAETPLDTQNIPQTPPSKPHNNPKKKPSPPPRKHIKGIKKIYAIASGKGGVGKSTLAANLAISLSNKGKKIGLLDADIYGPSQPRLFGLSDAGQPPIGKNGPEPHEKHGIKIFSMGFLIDAETPLVWRGPMVQGAIQQMLFDVNWGELDILIIDLPPGTGDAQLTLAQKIWTDGAIIISTPQDIALIDARKAIEMFNKTDVPVLGIVENMSYHNCTKCGHKDEIFGNGGAKEEAKKRDIEFLGEIPLAAPIRELSDKGTPISLEDIDSKYAKNFSNIADKILKNTEKNTEEKIKA